jgi:hypothetical protein
MKKNKIKKYEGGGEVEETVVQEQPSEKLTTYEKKQQLINYLYLFFNSVSLSFLSSLLII